MIKYDHNSFYAGATTPHPIDALVNRERQQILLLTLLWLQVIQFLCPIKNSSYI
jgi:hypothetical protein